MNIHLTTPESKFEYSMCCEILDISYMIGIEYHNITGILYISRNVEELNIIMSNVLRYDDL